MTGNGIGSATSELPLQACHRARMARDPRFDGRFFVAISTTGIFCRPICPSPLAKESHVQYFALAAQALNAGYRPCLRCRPESAPDSWAWRGTQTTVARAQHLIEQGALVTQSLPQLAERLGVSDRYLRMLFQQQIGMSPKQYSLYHQLMFAKSLLHNSALSVTQIGLASGFHSTRRFNDAFKKQLHLSPSQVRREAPDRLTDNQVLLHYRGQLNWRYTLDFLAKRAVDGLEKVTEHSYARYCQIEQASAWFEVTPLKPGTLVMQFRVTYAHHLPILIRLVRQRFDLDCDTDVIEAHLNQVAPGLVQHTGLRIPGAGSLWEAGVRAILGQQVTVKSAVTQLNRLVAELSHERERQFPTPQQVIDSDLSCLKMPTSRRETLKRLAEWVVTHGESEPSAWIAIKGIGPWTVHYAQLRGAGDPNCYLEGDLLVKKRSQQFPSLNRQSVAPWGSYATFHLWSLS
nr:Ada metal-binding domain-containing protein [Vibrio agarilyticus]